MTNKNDLNFSIFEFATQFKLLKYCLHYRSRLRYQPSFNLSHRCRTSTFRQFLRDFGSHPDNVRHF